MNIITFESLTSTNDYLMDLSKKNANSWTVIHAINQTNGKGYAGNRWEVNPNQNLTFSLLIKSDLNYQDLIYLNQWVANCIYTSLSQLQSNVSIKWPNDIILNNKKVCGVLIESYRKSEIMHSIIGIGINVNQCDFNHLTKATSLKNESHFDYDIMTIMSDLLQTFEKDYHYIENRNWNQISEFYNSKLFRKDRISQFRINNNLVEGIIRKTTNQGSLIVEIDGVEKEFLHKQIELIF